MPLLAPMPAGQMTSNSSWHSAAWVDAEKALAGSELLHASANPGFGYVTYRSYGTMRKGTFATVTTDKFKYRVK